MTEQDDLLKQNASINLTVQDWWYLIQLLQNVCIVNPAIVNSGDRWSVMNFETLTGMMRITHELQEQLKSFAETKRMLELLQAMQRSADQQGSPIGFTAPADSDEKPGDPQGALPEPGSKPPS